MFYLPSMRLTLATHPSVLVEITLVLFVQVKRIGLCLVFSLY